MKDVTYQTALMYAFLIASVESQGIVGSLSLVSAVYTSLVRGSKFIRNAMYGAGALGKLFGAVDDLLVAGKNETVSTEEPPDDHISEDAGTINKEPNNLLADDLHDDYPDVTDIQSKKSGAISALIEESPKIDLCQMNNNGEVLCDSDSRKPDVSTPPEAQNIPEESDFEGCGGLGLHFTNFKLPIPHMTKCCKEHSECYLTSCRTKKTSCDRILRRCMFNACSKRKSGDKLLQRSCRATSKLLFFSTMLKSSQLYKDAQRQLKCIGKNDRHRRQR